MVAVDSSREPRAAGRGSLSAGPHSWRDLQIPTRLPTTLGTLSSLGTLRAGVQLVGREMQARPPPRHASPAKTVDMATSVDRAPLRWVSRRAIPYAAFVPHARLDASWLQYRVYIPVPSWAIDVSRRR
ncbi:hypothetical protein L1887_54792 [Cichorium endivia]|nr:hypothetical protein L1887_54792 [Cichorium endivia]